MIKCHIKDKFITEKYLQKGLQLQSVKSHKTDDN
jgi:hypothetical protein